MDREELITVLDYAQKNLSNDLEVYRDVMSAVIDYINDDEIGGKLEKLNSDLWLLVYEMDS